MQRNTPKTNYLLKEKRCAYCFNVLPFKCFIGRKAKNGSIYYDSYCEGCKKIYNAKKSMDVRIKTLRHYSNGKQECANCGYDIFEALSIDHIHNNGNIHRRGLFGKAQSGGRSFYEWLIKNNYPKGYQVLCRNCNWLKGAYLDVFKRIDKGV